MSFVSSPRKKHLVNPTLAILIIIIAIGAAVVYAVFTQPIPSTQIPPETVTNNCPGAIVTTSQLTADSGVIEYTCTGGGAVINTVTGSATPTFHGFTACPTTVTSPCYADFGYLASSDTTDCVTGSSIGAWFHPLANMTAVGFTTGSWDYCAFYAAPATGGTLSGFSIVWP